MKKAAILLVFMVSTHILFAQRTDTIYYDANWQKTNITDSIEYYRVISFDNTGKPTGTTRDYYKTGEVQWEGKLLSVEPDVQDGKAIWYHPNGQKSQECIYEQGKIIGKLYQWDENGNLSGVQIYIDGTNIAQTIVDKQLYDFSPDTIQPTIAYLNRHLGLSLRNDMETALLLDDWGTFHSNLKDYEQALNFYFVAARIQESLDNKIGLANTYNSIAFNYFFNNEIDYSKNYFEKAAKILKKELGENHHYYLETIEILNKVKQQLSVSKWVQLNDKMLEYMRKSNFEKAIEYGLQASNAAEIEFGKNHEHYVTALNNLARLYKSMGNYVAAEPLYIESKEITTKMHGKESFEYAKVIFELGALYCEMFKYPKAESLLLDAKEIIANTLGKRNYEYATTLTYLAKFYKITGNYKAAETYYNKSNSIIKQTFNKHHYKYISSLIDFAQFYSDIKKYAEAEQIYKNTISLIKDKYGSNHIRYLMALHSLAELYSKSGDAINAEKKYKKCIEIADRSIGKQDFYYSTLLYSFSLHYRRFGKYSLAEKFMKEYVKNKLENLGESHSDYINSVLSLATFYSYIDNYEKAEQTYLKAKELWKNTTNNDIPEYINTLLEFSKFYMKFSKFDLAEKISNESLQVCQNNLNEKSKSYLQIIANLASIYYYSGRLVKSKNQINSVLKLCDDLFGKNNNIYISSLNTKGMILSSKKKYLKAKESYLEAIHICENYQLQNSDQYFMALSNLAHIYAMEMNFDKAIDYTKQAMEYRATKYGKNDFFFVGEAIKLSNIYFNLSQNELAEEILLNLLKSTTKGTFQNATVLLELGNYYMRNNMPERAKKNIKKSKDILEKLGYQNSIIYASNLLALSRISSYNQKYNEATDLTEQANNIILKTGMKKHINKKPIGGKPFSMHKNFNQKNIQAALNDLLYSIRNYRVNTPPKNLILWNLKVFNPIIRALEEYHQKSPYLQAFLTEYAYWYYRFAEYDDYISTYRVIDSINTLKLKERFNYMADNELLEQGAILQKNRSVFFSHAFDLLHIYPELTKDVYNNILKSKGIILSNQAYLRKQITQSNDTTLINLYNKISDIKDQINTLQSMTLDDNLNSIDSLYYIANMFEKDMIKKASNSKIEFNNDALLLVKYKSIQSALLSDQAAIEFTSFQYHDDKRWTDSTYYCALVLTKGMEYPEMVYLCEERELQDVLQSGSPNIIYTNRGSKPLGFRTITGSQLDSLIWNPVAPFLDSVNTVYLSPSGLLHRVAFAAIPTSDTTCLSDHYKLNIVSSTRVLTKRDKLLFSPDMKATLYGNIYYEMDSAEIIKMSERNRTPSQTKVISRGFNPGTLGGDAGWEQLDGTAHEIFSLAKLLSNKGVRPEMKTRNRASEESFKAYNNCSPEILHIATHGFFMELSDDDRRKKKAIYNNSDLLSNNETFVMVDNPLFRSGLVFAGANRAWRGAAPIPNVEDGILTAYEVSNINLNSTQLVVLSACETGLGDIKGNEGVFGLQRSFKMAGVDYIIYSLWDVPDHETMELMERLYINWLSGMSIREAFDKTQIFMKNKYRNEPFKWAAFVLME